MSITRDDVAQATREWFGAYADRDYRKAAAIESRAFGWARDSGAPRDITVIGEAAYLEAVERTMGALESYRPVVEELHTAVEGEVGMAWGVLVEEYKEHGREPWTRRSRFSHVMVREDAGWRMLLFHRDVQPFAAGGDARRA